MGSRIRFFGPNSILSDWSDDATLTASSGFGTISQYDVKARRVGDSLEVVGSWRAGTIAATTAAIGIPSGLNIDLSKLPGNSRAYVGNWANATSGGVSNLYQGEASVLFSDGVDTTSVFFALQGGTTGLNKATCNGLFSSGDYQSFSFIIPILEWS